MPVALRLTVEKAERLYRGQEHFWRVARALGADGKTFTASAIATVSAEPHIGTITTWLRRLWKAGVVMKEGRVTSSSSGRNETVWRLGQSPETLPIIGRDGTVRRPRSVRQQMWNVMRGPSGRGGFSYADLVAYGSTDDLPVKPITAKSYIQELKRGGYLMQLHPGGPGTPAVWRLRPAMNTGPKPPMILTAKVIYDQNRSRVMGETIADEVEA